MTTNTQRSVLLIGKSQRVLDDTVTGLHDLGYIAASTNDFSDITPRFDVTKVDVVVFGGQVLAARRAELRQEITASNPRVRFVQGLAGIPGLLINQVQASFTGDPDAPGRAPAYGPEDRSVRLRLAEPADVKATAWWQTSFVPPDPRSDSRVLLDDRLAAGEHSVAVPDDVPASAAFATVQVDAAIYAFSIATE